ncbi:YchJ family protein [soil metagenome]
MTCPCLSGLPYDECCGPLHRGDRPAATAERLMRARYSAYARGLPDFLLATWHLSTRPAALDLDPGLRWYRLEILSRTRGGMLDAEGTVEFRAAYRAGPQAGQQHEVSSFVREGGSWYYLDGE